MAILSAAPLSQIGLEDILATFEKLFFRTFQFKVGLLKNSTCIASNALLLLTNSLIKMFERDLLNMVREGESEGN